MNETIEVVVIAAMKEEAAPFLDASAEKIDFPVGEAWKLKIEHTDAVLVQSGIGLVNCAIATAHAIAQFSPQAILSTGSAGGLAQGLYIGDVVVGKSYVYSDADATAFGYTPGQIPGMPENYDAPEELVEAARAARGDDQRVLAGRIVSGNTFVDGRTLDYVRSTFPGALAADMESAAIAQTAHVHGIPFVSVRAISDLCGPNAGEDFSMSIEEVSQRAAGVVRRVVGGLPHD